MILLPGHGLVTPWGLERTVAMIAGTSNYFSHVVLALGLLSQ